MTHVHAEQTGIARIEADKPVAERRAVVARDPSAVNHAVIGRSTGCGPLEFGRRHAAGCTVTATARATAAEEQSRESAQQRVTARRHGTSR